MNFLRVFVLALALTSAVSTAEPIGIRGGHDSSADTSPVPEEEMEGRPPRMNIKTALNAATTSIGALAETSREVQQEEKVVLPFHLVSPKMNTKTVLYFTYNGDYSNNFPINNILSYDTNGNQIGPLDGVLDTQTLPYRLNKLRGMTIGPDGDLYVCVGRAHLSKIHRFNGIPNKSGKHEFKELFIDESMYLHNRKGSKPIGAHPYQLLFSSDWKTAYVSNQNTKDIRLFSGPKTTEPGKPIADGRIKGFDDVRGIAMYDKTDMLFVAAKFGGLYMMKRGETQASQGQNLMNQKHNPQGLLICPIALLIRDDILYICNSNKDEGGGNILYVDLSKGEDALVEVFIDNEKGPRFNHPSGLAFGPDGKFYVNDHEGLATISYDVNADGTSARNAKILIEHKDPPIFVFTTRYL